MSLEMCIVCFEQEVKTVHPGCGHMSCCTRCALDNNLQSCPICRRASQPIEIYKAGNIDDMPAEAVPAPLPVAAPVPPEPVSVTTNLTPFMNAWIAVLLPSHYIFKYYIN
jgi:hypothetical protein